MSNQITVFLLAGGLEIIGNAEKIGKGYKLYRPYKVLQVPLVQPAAKGLSINILMQVVPLLSTTVESSIVLHEGDWIGDPLTPSKEAEMGYLQQTSGIQLASAISGH